MPGAMATTDQLEARAHELEAEGADPRRVELLRRARRFKRSWIEMAEALVEVRVTRAYEAWGYPEFYAYCAGELLLKRRTVEKLTGSYNTIKRHAPDVLEGDGEVPSFDSVDYFTRALDRAGYNDEGWEDVETAEAPEAIQELRQAVFDESRPVSSLRREFHPILFKKSDDEATREALEKANSYAQRLCRILPDVPGLSKTRVAETAAALDGLCRDLDTLLGGESRKAS
jgi:hypothetical protein